MVHLTCLVCNGDVYDDNLFKSSLIREELLKLLCSIFNVSDEAGESFFNQKNVCCSICRTHINEFFRIEKQINELIQRLAKIKRGIGSLIVETFPVTIPQTKNHSLKRVIYETWLEEEKKNSSYSYQSHSYLMKTSMIEIPLLVEGESIEMIVSNQNDNNDDNNIEDRMMGSPTSPDDNELMNEDNEHNSNEKNADLSASQTEIPTESKGNQPEQNTQIKNNPRKTKLEIFRCPYCQKTTTSKTNFDQHLRCHTGEKHISCRFGCGVKFSQFGSRRRHERKNCPLKDDRTFEPKRKNTNEDGSKIIKEKPIRSKPNPANKPFSFKCDYCGKLWRDKFTFEAHVRVHTGEKPHQCRVEGCERRFNDLGNRSKHEKNHDMSRYLGEPKYECEFCKKKYHIRVSLYHHRRYAHLGVKQKNKACSCPECGKILSRPFHLMMHLKFVHEGHIKDKKPYKGTCKICGKPCRTLSDAIKHEKTHIPNKTHAVLSQHKCPECPEHLGFSRKDILRQHFRLTHPDIPLPENLKWKIIKNRKPRLGPRIRKRRYCPLEKDCTFTDARPLKRHILKYHTGENPPQYLGRQRKREQIKKVSKNDDTSDTDNEVFDGTSFTSLKSKTDYGLRNRTPRMISSKSIGTSYKVEAVKKFLKQKTVKSTKQQNQANADPLEIRTVKLCLPRIEEEFDSLNVTANARKILLELRSSVQIPNVVALQQENLYFEAEEPVIKTEELSECESTNEVTASSSARNLQLPSLSKIAAILGQSTSK